MQKQFPIDHWLARERKKEWAEKSHHIVIDRMKWSYVGVDSHITIADCYYAQGRRRRWWNCICTCDWIVCDTIHKVQKKLIWSLQSWCNFAIPSVGLGRISWLDGMHQLFWLFFLQNCLLRITHDIQLSTGSVIFGHVWGYVSFTYLCI